MEGLVDISQIIFVILAIACMGYAFIEGKRVEGVLWLILLQILIIGEKL